MTFFHRAATFAALSFCALGFSAISTPGRALPTAHAPSAAVLLPAPLAPLPAASTEAAPLPVPAIFEPAGEAPAAEDDAADSAPRFQSLAAAIAAHGAASDADAELLCLAGAVYHEAKGEPLAGQLAVAEVILNRAASGRFPRSVCGVVTQPGQFSFVRDGRIPAVDPSRSAYRTALAVAQVAAGDIWDSPADRALFFHARHVAPRWSKTRVASIGNHIFYR